MEAKFRNFVWIVVGLVAVMAAVSIIASILFDHSYPSSNTGTYGPYWMMGYGFYGMGIIMPIVGVVSVIFVLVFLYYFFGWFRDPYDHHQSGSSASTPEDIARERLARGEISEDEYRRILELIKK
ncbi:MAG: SHOCT domain-containing protein [Thermoplasmataceae archaeon]